MNMNVFGFMIRIILSLLLGLLFALMMMPFFGWSSIGLLFGPLFLLCMEIIIPIVLKHEAKKYAKYEKTFTERALSKYDCRTRFKPIVNGLLYLFEDHLMFVSLEKKSPVIVDLKYLNLKEIIVYKHTELVIDNYVFACKDSQIICDNIKIMIEKQSGNTIEKCTSLINREPNE
jgi:hypothetical protein